MKNFHGRSVSEILNLSADIVKNCTNKADYINYAHRIAYFADDEIYDNGDAYMESVGYSLSTARNCAVKIAEMLAYKGHVDIE